jgi:HEAT repeat protein
MTYDLFKLAGDLVNRRIARKIFEKLTGSASDGRAFALKLMADAISKRDPLNVAAALALGFEFGVSPEHVDLLIGLVDADWDYNHEDVVDSLGELGDPKAIDALFKATQIVPRYLAYDDTRSLASRAILALGNLNDERADAKLRLLANSDCQVIKEDALSQLERRRASK